MPNKEFEPLLYAASEAWAAKTGKEVDEWSFIASVNYETGCNLSRWSTQKPRELTPERLNEQHERNYERALSKVAHVSDQETLSTLKNSYNPTEIDFQSDFSTCYRKPKHKLVLTNRILMYADR